MYSRLCEQGMVPEEDPQTVNNSLIDQQFRKGGRLMYPEHTQNVR